MELAIRAATMAIIGLIVPGIIIFLPAGTLAYWQGWAFIVVFSISTNIIGVYLALMDPALLERRIRAGPRAETRPVQKAIITVAFAGMAGLVIFSVLDHRFGWSFVLAWLSVLGDVLVTAGLMIDLRVFRENSYGASTIEKMEGQKVISTGPYALVRHPMYVGVLVMVVGLPWRSARCGGSLSCCSTCLSWSCASSTRRQCCGKSSTVTPNTCGACATGSRRACGDRALAQPRAAVGIEQIEPVRLEIDGNRFAHIGLKILGRLDGDRIGSGGCGHQRVVADQLGGEHLARDRPLA
jgi:protein-S-isoprenylcysteine O-methyltransferase Ste14